MPNGAKSKDWIMKLSPQRDYFFHIGRNESCTRKINEDFSSLNF